MGSDGFLLSGPEPFIKPLVKSVRAEFKTPSRALYKKVRDDIIHRVCNLNKPVSLDILPVTAVDVAPVLPPVPFGSLTDFGRRLGLTEVSTLERADLRSSLHSQKTRRPSPPPPSHSALHTPLLTSVQPDSLPLPSIEISPPKPSSAAAPSSRRKPRTPVASGLSLAQSASNSRVRKFSPEIPVTAVRRSLDNSALVEISPEAVSAWSPLTPPSTAGLPAAASASAGVRVTLDLSMSGEDRNLLEIEELLCDAERLLGGDRITEAEISRELRLLDEISANQPLDLRNSWSDIEAELDRLRSELHN